MWYLGFLGYVDCCMVYGPLYAVSSDYVMSAVVLCVGCCMVFGVLYGMRSFVCYLG